VSSLKFSLPAKSRLKTDLHVHTTASDGAYSPREVFRLAKERGITVLAITDHDTVGGLPEAEKVAEEYGLSFVPGIELSTIHEEHEIHILGYQIQRQNEQLLASLQTLAAARDNRASKIVAKLNELGYPVTMEEVKSKAGSELIGRPHIALAMMDHGIIKNIEEGFARFLSPGGRAYVSRYRISPCQALKLINAAGGIAVLAHPGLDFPARLLPELIVAGLGGIEVYHPDNSLQIRDYYQRRAHESGLIITGGSDFHGHEADDLTYFGQLPTPLETLVRFAELSSPPRLT